MPASIPLRDDFTPLELRRLASRCSNANEECPDGLTDRKAPRRERYLSDAQMSELGEIVEIGPDPATVGVVRLARLDL